MPDPQRTERGWWWHVSVQTVGTIIAGLVLGTVATLAGVLQYDSRRAGVAAAVLVLLASWYGGAPLARASSLTGWDGALVRAILFANGLLAAPWAYAVVAVYTRGFTGWQIPDGLFPG